MKLIGKILSWRPNITRQDVIFITRWYPIVTTFMVTMGLLFLVFDVEYYRQIAPVFGCSVLMSACQLIASWHYKFCFWHQMLLYNLIVVSLIAFLKSFGLFADLFTVRILLLINVASIVLSYLSYVLLSKIKCHD